MEIVVLGALYFVPLMVACARKHREAQVAVLNLFLGWTLVFWVLALVWALGEKPPRYALPPAPLYDTRTGERLPPPR